ncbi:MAG TPA: hypothetical protein VGG51_14345 [Candidatus Cybelea sp.]|jgi:hypothetical protein
MKFSAIFAAIVGIGAAVVAVSGCANVGPAPISGGIPVPPNPTPPANWLYVDHLGTFYAYHLPLTAGAKPARTLEEWPGLAGPPAIAVGPYGEVALASTESIRIFKPPIVSFAQSHAKLSIKLTPAITEVGPYGADLVDMEYDPNDNLWLLNNLGHEISELRSPISKKSVAAVRIAFGQPGSKTAGFSTLMQARFDVNAALYVYARATTIARLFKLSFPYAKQPSSLGLDLAQANFVDPSQYLPTASNPASLLLGQYTGALRSPSPGSPPSPPVNVMGQFDEPLQPVQGLFPNEHSNTIVSALAADPPRLLFYTLALADGSLSAYTLPMQPLAKPKFSIRCLAGASGCAAHDHLFLAP